MFALIEDGAVKQYPYNIAQLKLANPNVSFPANPSDETLQEFRMFRVFFATQPTVTNMQVLEEDPPVFRNEDQRWTQVWRVRDMTAEEVQQRDDGQAGAVRAERNAKLAELDWTQLADTPVDQSAWATYRQALRDISAQAGFPWTIEWPTQP
tara:strand:- start:6079 stop:6534 length:456 start_codon:yes stop_codon:yes gene_type:complete